MLDDVPEARMPAVRGLSLLCKPVSKPALQLERQAGRVHGPPLHPVAPSSPPVLRGVREPAILLVGAEGGRGAEPEGAQTTVPVAAGALGCASSLSGKRPWEEAPDFPRLAPGCEAGRGGWEEERLFHSVEAVWREETMRDRGLRGGGKRKLAAFDP